MERLCDVGAARHVRGISPWLPTGTTGGVSLHAGTTSAAALMEDMGFSAAFNVQLHVPALKEAGVRSVLTSRNAFSNADVSSSPQTLPLSHAGF